jgi:3-phytase
MRRAEWIVCASVAAMMAPRPDAAWAGTVTVQPSVETDPVPSDSDAADDPAVWVHPTDPALSLIIGTDKDAGLAVYEPDGTQRQFIGGMRPNNVDVRYGFPLGDSTVDIVAFGDRLNQTIRIFRVDVSTRTLVNVTSGMIHVGVGEAYGFCLYRSRCGGAYYAFVNDQDGAVEQWRLLEEGGGIGATPVRVFEVGSQTEGMVADDELGLLYVGEESEGVWRYGAEPDAGTARALVDSTGSGGNLTADVEGLSIYYTRGGGGYLIASSQGSSEYVVYDRAPDNGHVLTFQIGAANGIDAVTGTDGIDVTNAPLGAAFPQGAFVAQDDENSGGNQNFKLVRWEVVARPGFFAHGPSLDEVLGEPTLAIDVKWDPRQPRHAADVDGDGDVGIVDLLVLIGAWGRCAGAPEPCPADADCDGTVGFLDLLALLAAW